VAHEVVHSIHRSREPGVVLKLDYEKAYDKVNIDFLFEVLRTRGFSPIWIRWLNKIVKVDL
jgi:mannosylglycoprotein endo-beta-mannosidase